MAYFCIDLTLSLGADLDAAWKSNPPISKKGKQAAMRKNVICLVDVPNTPEAVKSILRGILARTVWRINQRIDWSNRPATAEIV